MTDRIAGSTLPMPRPRIAVSLDARTLRRVDALVRSGLFASRSQAIQAALDEHLGRLDRSRLARESAKLVPRVEQRLCDEGLAEDLRSWPEY